jgi:hypothetical protein
LCCNDLLAGAADPLATDVGDCRIDLTSCRLRDLHEYESAVSAVFGIETHRRFSQGARASKEVKQEVVWSRADLRNPH